MIKRNLTILVLSVLLSACSMQAKLNRHYTGETIESATQEFKDIPSSKIPLNNGNTKVIFTKESFLGATTINQGSATLDPITTPPVKKTEQFIFTVDTAGVIIETDYDVNYQQ